MSSYYLNSTDAYLHVNGSTGDVDCQEHVANMTMKYLFGGNKENKSQNITYEENTLRLIKYIIHDYALPIVCVFGILGNILNLIVLTRKQLKCTMDRMEKSAHLGLLALAFSDMFFCLLALLVSFLPTQQVFSHEQFRGIIYYKVYHQPLLNIFMISSTWLTVIMALGRYVAICHPLHARGFINLKGTRISILFVFVGSILVNLPQFWYGKVSSISCADDTSCYCEIFLQKPNTYLENKNFRTPYNVCYTIIGIFIPLIVLTYCNVCLIQALRQSFKMQQMYRANQPRDAGHRITPTLITIIVLFTILVAPGELLKFFNQINTCNMNCKNKGYYYMYQNATEITNFMMVINFAINFVLYCVINVQFRKTVKNILCCKCASKKSAYIKANHQDHTNMTVTCNVSDIETEM